MLLYIRLQIILDLGMEIIMKKKITESDAWFYVGTVCLIIGLTYFIAYKIFDFKVAFSGADCIFAVVTHLYCPGCGGTRAVRSLLNFHFIESFLYNPLVLVSGLICAYFYIGAIITRLKKNGKVYAPFNEWFLWSILIVLGANVIIRNLLLAFWGIDYIGDLAKFWIK